MLQYILYSLIYISAFPLFAQTEDPGIALELFTDRDLFRPIGITNAGDGSGRLFVNEKNGRIKTFDAQGNPMGTFLDIGVKFNPTTGSPIGLLSVAFPSDYKQSGKFYVYYAQLDTTIITSDPSVEPDSTFFSSATLSRYSVSGTNPNRADRGSEQRLLTITKRSETHFGGEIAFDSEGLLYLSIGDDSPPGLDIYNNSQDNSTPLGSIVRLDVSGDNAVPAGNVGGWGDSRIFAIGVRNPFRMSIDPVDNELWIGDVGEKSFEEINVISLNTSAGTNFGYPCFEGYQETGDQRNASCTDPVNVQFPLHVIPYPNGAERGNSITGGVVYRGAEHAELYGYYIFGESGTGKVSALKRSPNQPNGLAIYDAAGTVPGVTDFGTDENGEIYAVSISDSKVYKVTTERSLPAELIAFEADKIEGNVVLNWETANEVNVSHFEIWAAGDDNAFAKTDQVSAKGAGTYAHTLSDLRAGTKYFQLHTVDLDGSTALSSIVSVDIAARTVDSELRLQKFDGGFRVVDDEGRAPASRLLVQDATGRVVYQSANASLEVDASGWSPGIYYVRVGATVLNWVQL